VRLTTEQAIIAWAIYYALCWEILIWHMIKWYGEDEDEVHMVPEDGRTADGLEDTQGHGY
jgi:hypothetical protein